MRLAIKLLIINILFTTVGYSQTFSALTGANAALKENGATIPFPIASTNQWDAYRWVKSYVTVSGLGALTSGTLELIQVNLDYGDASQSFYTSTTTDIFLKSPNGSEYKILDGGTVVYKDVNVKLRDNAQLNRPCGKTNSKPYAVGYYRTEVSDVYDNFLGEDPNGNWEVRFDNNSTRTRPVITNIELVFGTLTEIDITSSTDNDACASPQYFCQEAEIIYHNTGRAGDASVDPPPTATNACAWNNNLDNTSWFAFEATQTTAVVTISGMSGAVSQQFIVVGNSSGGNSCTASDLYTVTGGCPTDAVNTLPTAYNNGTYYNMHFNLSGLTSGDTYYLVTDGNGGTSSSAYLTVSGSSACGSVLPIELKSFKGINNTLGNELSWTTVTEINNDFFTLERSIDAVNWEIINITEGAGNSNMELSYEFTDADIVSEIYYYRLKQTDYNGDFSYSPIISILSTDYCEFNIYPNPVKKTFNISVNGKEIDVFNIEVSNLFGNIVKIENNISNKSVIDIEDLYAGIYFVKIISTNKEYVKKLIKE